MFLLTNWAPSVQSQPKLPSKLYYIILYLAVPYLPVLLQVSDLLSELLLPSHSLSFSQLHCYQLLLQPHYVGVIWQRRVPLRRETETNSHNQNNHREDPNSGCGVCWIGTVKYQGCVQQGATFCNLQIIFFYVDSIQTYLCHMKSLAPGALLEQCFRTVFSANCILANVWKSLHIGCFITVVACYIILLRGYCCMFEWKSPQNNVPWLCSL